MEKYNKILIISLIILLTLTIKQQFDIYFLKKDLSDIKTDIYNCNNSVVNVENNLSEEIDKVRKAVIIWSN
jgi:hypothetical protein